MATVHRPPDRPIEDYEAIRDDWIVAITSLMKDASQWSDELGWVVSPMPKQMYESFLGSYEAPRVLIDNGSGKVLLDPVARYVPGCDGAVDLLSVPDYDGILVTRSWNEWKFQDGGHGLAESPWSKDAFIRAVNQMAAA